MTERTIRVPQYPFVAADPIGVGDLVAINDDGQAFNMSRVGKEMDEIMRDKGCDVQPDAVVTQ